MNNYGEEPSQKRLRQSSIFECFEKIPSRSHEKTPKRHNSGMQSEQLGAVMETTQGHTTNSRSESLSENASGFQEFLDETPPLFSSSTNEGEASSIDEYYLGVSLANLRRTPECALMLPPLNSSEDHTVLFKTDSKFDVPPKPSHDSYTDKWDENFVRMPCSPNNMYPVEGLEKHKVVVESRWDLIRRSLNEKIKTSYDLQNAVVKYNSGYAQKSAFNGLHHFFVEILSPEENEAFFETILPRMIRLALQLPYLCTQPIPLLKQNLNHTITLSQLQVACLLANAFFCTFPRRSHTRNSEYRNYPSINFIALYSAGDRKGRSNRKAEKLKCLINYFRRVTMQEPCGAISFKRQCISAFPDWETSEKALPKLHVTSYGTIEKEGNGMLQMDFANKLVGGGVLGWGCVQEEIRFIICPEMIVSRLFTECLGANECLLMKGSEQFSKYTGYGDTFEFSGNFIDNIPRDSWRRKFTEVVAVDAKSFRSSIMQFDPEWLMREVNKAYCGFCSIGTPTANLEAVATGNWGCGVYKGDPRLKAFLQFIAAAEAGRDVVYFTFQNVELCKDIHKMYTILQEKKITTGNLWTLIANYTRSTGNSKPSGRGLYDEIQHFCTTTNSYDSETDIEGSNS